MTKSFYLIVLILSTIYLPAAEISHWSLNDASDDLIAQDSLSTSNNAEIIGNGVNFQQEGTLSSKGTAASFDKDSYLEVPYKESILLDNQSQKPINRTNNSTSLKKGK